MSDCVSIIFNEISLENAAVESAPKMRKVKASLERPINLTASFYFHQDGRFD